MYLLFVRSHSIAMALDIVDSRPFATSLINRIIGPYFKDGSLAKVSCADIRIPGTLSDEARANRCTGTRRVQYVNINRVPRVLLIEFDAAVSSMASSTKKRLGMANVRVERAEPDTFVDFFEWPRCGYITDPSWKRHDGTLIHVSLPRALPFKYAFELDNCELDASVRG